MLNFKKCRKQRNFFALHIECEHLNDFQNHEKKVVIFYCCCFHREIFHNGNSLQFLTLIIQILQVSDNVLSTKR